MATVTGYTAERMQEIEDGTVVDGNIVGDDLVLLRRDGTPIIAGDVRGPQGDQGLVGPTSIAVVTSATRPTGGALFEGLFIYETDTDKVYSWNGTAWIPRGIGSVICTSATRPAAPFAGLEIFETDTKRKLIYDGTAWKATSAIGMPRCRVSRTAGINIASTTSVLLTFNIERYDPFNLHDNATNPSRITIPTGGDGVYMIGSTINYADAAGGVRNADLRVNGVAIEGDGGRPANGTLDGDTVQVHTLYDLVANDYVEVSGYQTSGGTITMTGSFYLQWMSPI